APAREQGWRSRTVATGGLALPAGPAHGGVAAHQGLKHDTARLGHSARGTDRIQQDPSGEPPRRGTMKAPCRGIARDATVLRRSPMEYDTATTNAPNAAARPRGAFHSLLRSEYILLAV